METHATTPAPSDRKALPDHLTDLFREYLPDVDLDRVRVHDTLPWIARFAPISVRAMALGRNIYFDGNFDPVSTDGIATIGHELAHVSQWGHAGGFVLGPVSFAILYVWDYALNRLRGMSRYEAYRAIRFERDAERFERSIRDMLGATRLPALRPAGAAANVSLRPPFHGGGSRPQVGGCGEGPIPSQRAECQDLSSVPTTSPYSASRITRSTGRG